MRKNGFTLIELLAVIVILAIIALIATPIILGIINDAREESQERSVELYASAIRNGIAAYQLREGKEVLPGTYKSSDLTFVEYEGDVECDTIDIYEDGGVYVADCKVNDILVDYSYGTKQVAKGTMDICNPLSDITEGVYTAGDKYECDVDPNKEGYDYIFYVLNSDGTSVNLIMDSNITRTGEAVKSSTMSDKGKVAWYADARDNSLGPITAMNLLQTATAGWTNTNELTINKFTACDSEVGCTNKPMTEYVVNARMLYYSEISSYSASANNAYLFDNLDCEDYTSNGGPIFCVDGVNHITGVYGYWTLSSIASDSYDAWYMYFSGSKRNNAVNNGGDSVGTDGGGVRPVINLSI